MKKNPYLPRTEADRLIWLLNFLLKLPGYAATFAITAGEITLLGDMVPFYQALIAQVAAMKASAKDWRQYKDDFCNDPLLSPLPAVPGISISLPTPPANSGLWAFISNLVERIKATKPGYTNAIGLELRIVGDAMAVDIGTSQPILEFFKEPHGWRIEFNLKSFFDGVSIYKKLPGATDFTHLATDRHAPYIDNAPVENNTQYYAFYLIGDDEVGLQSDIVTLKVSS